MHATPFYLMHATPCHLVHAKSGLMKPDSLHDSCLNLLGMFTQILLLRLRQQVT